jgi:hypothetical protein
VPEQSSGPLHILATFDTGPLAGVLHTRREIIVQK